MILIEKKLGKKVYRARRNARYNRYQINDNTAYVPEAWAAEAVDILYENMLYGSLVHRDFENEVANYGDTVHTRVPSEFTGKRKQNDMDDLVDQDARSTMIDVVLNQRAYVSFLLGDGEMSLSFKDLVRIYLNEAMMAQARLLDQVVGGQVYQFLGNASGQLGLASSSTVNDYLLDARKIMNDNKAPEAGRMLALASRTETAMQKTDLFKRADAIGFADGNNAIRNAVLGRLAGFNTFLELNTPSVAAVTLATATTVNDATALAGDLTITVTSAAATPAGSYITFVGDLAPYRVLSVSTATLTLNRPLRYNVANGAAVATHSPGAINQASAIAAGTKTAAVSDGYPANWLTMMNVDGTGVPHVGQLVSFKSAGGTVYTPEYCILQVEDGGSSTYNILLDRPLENTLANNDIVYYGPAGDYNFGFQRNAIALVSRPLVLPDPRTGVRAAVGVLKNMSVRVTLTYDGKKQATRVVVDGLYGVKVLNTKRGVAMLG